MQYEFYKKVKIVLHGYLMEYVIDRTVPKLANGAIDAQSIVAPLRIE